MLGLLAPIVLGVLVAFALGGSLERWSSYRMRWWPLAMAALGVQILLYSPPLNTWPSLVAVGVPIGLATVGTVLLVLLRNAIAPLQPALLTAAMGIGLNLVVMLANGGWMPRADAQLPLLLNRDGSDVTITNTAPVGTESRLTWFADTIVQPDWLPFANAMSPGDLLLSLGAAWWAFALTRRPKTQKI